MPCIEVKDKNGKVVATVCFCHDSPEVRNATREELEQWAGEIAGQARDVRREAKKILEFPQPPGEIESGGEE